jgi:hypothetical protein
MSLKRQRVDASVESTTLQQRFQDVMAQRVLLLRDAFSLLQPSAARDELVKAMEAAAALTSSLPEPLEGPLSRLSAPLLRLMMQFLPVEEHLLCRAVSRTIRSSAYHQHSWPQRMVLPKSCRMLAVWHPPRLWVSHTKPEPIKEAESQRRSAVAHALACEGMRGRVTSIHASCSSWRQLVEMVAPSLTSIRFPGQLELKQPCPVRH